MITGALFLLIILKQLLWAAFIPVWQFPDEQAHFAQVQDFAEGQPDKVNSKFSTSKEISLCEELLGTNRDGFGNNKYTYHPEFNIPYTITTTGLYEQEIKSIPQNFRKELIVKEATAYPPLYYQIESIGYRLFYDSDLFMRIFASRLVNLFFYLITAGLVIVSANLVFPASRLKQFVLSIFVLFHPMFSFVFAGINSDNLYNLYSTVVIFLCLKVISKGWNIRIITAILLTIVVGQLIKPQVYLVYFLLLYPVGIGMFNRRKIFTGSLLILTIVVLGFRTIFSSILNGIQLLPEIPSLNTLLTLDLWSFGDFFMNSLKHIYREIIPWYWGVYRWLSLTYPRPVHRIINWISLISVFGLIKYIFLCVKHDKFNFFKKPAVFFIYSICVYGFGLILFNFLFTLSHGFQLGLQGRYFFPVILPLSSLLLYGLDEWISLTKWESIFWKILAIGMIIFHFYALVFVTLSYYPGKSVAEFFQYASQYKPVFFKSPVLEILFFSAILVHLFFVFILFRFRDINQKEK